MASPGYVFPWISDRPVLAAEINPDNDQHQHEEIHADKERILQIPFTGKPDAGYVFPVGLGECFEKDFDIRKHHHAGRENTGNHNAADESVITGQFL